MVIKEKEINLDTTNKKDVYEFICGDQNPFYYCGFLATNRGFKKYFPELYEDLLKYDVDKNLPFKEQLYLFLHDEHKRHTCKMCDKYVSMRNFPYGYHIYCSSKCELNDETVINKFKQTNIEKYGVPYPSQSDEIKDKTKQTCLEKYGVEYTGQAQCKKDHAKETFLRKYGKEHYLQTEECRKRIQETTLKKYGVKCVTQSEEVMEKIRNTKIERYGVDNYVNPEKTKKTNLERYGVTNYMKTDEGKAKLRASILKKYEDETYRSPVNKGKFGGTSQSEIELGKFIESIYNGKILRNKRYKVLNDLELDIYLPDNNIAFEFNGDYWHMNPKKYTENEYNESLHSYAKDVWAKDKFKEELCKNNNIELITIWEYDWKNNKNEIKETITKKLGLIE